MTAVVSARAVREVRHDTFAGVTGIPVVEIAASGPELVVTFAADLDAATEGQVRDLMTTPSDADQAARANLSALRDTATADPSLENVAALATATAAYRLGER